MLVPYNVRTCLLLFPTVNRDAVPDTVPGLGAGDAISKSGFKIAFLTSMYGQITVLKHLK